jgi:hypothetical protein
MTRKTPLAKIRYWFAWKIMPVNKETISDSLSDEVPDSYPEEYNTVGQVLYLIGLTENSYFD